MAAEPGQGPAPGGRRRAARRGRPLALTVAALPVPLLLVGLAALAMLVPAAHARVLAEHALARAFFYPAMLFLLLALLIGIALAGRRIDEGPRGDLATLAFAFAGLPLVLAVPFREAVPDTTWFNAWFEMVSSFTTTGATLYDAPGRLPPTVHLWRALVGWLGGLFVLVLAAAILAPMNLGGFEVLSGEARPLRRPEPGREGAAHSDRTLRLIRAAQGVMPAYALLTFVLWIGLMLAGERALVAACHAMSTLSTSGISPGQGLAGSPAGFAGEFLIFLFLFFALSRRLMPGAPASARGRGGILADPELRMGLVLVVALAAILFLRHFAGALDDSDPEDVPAALGALWGGLFTLLSFLTTTGFVPEDWAAARIWSNLPAPGLVLLGVAAVGGGVATTAGGVKLLRVHALYKHGLRELERIVTPSSVGGEGPEARRLRRQGAYLAWLFVMLSIMAAAVLIAALGLAGLDFEAAVILAFAGLSTTGQLAQVAGDAPIAYSALGTGPKAIIAAAMVLGRLETLAILALLAPPSWRD